MPDIGDKIQGVRRIWEYTRFATRFFLLRAKGPYFLGLVTNDTCNLGCINCHVANTEGANMSIAEIESILTDYHNRGVRFLTLAGGEPYLWRDGPNRIRDVVTLARRIGYLNVNMFTNGTRPMNATPDFTWVSIDGLEDRFEKIRGIQLDRILRNVRKLKTRFAIVFTVNTVNHTEIDAFLERISRDFPGTGVLFFFHTPYYGRDYLYLTQSQRLRTVDRLLSAKRRGLPVLNSAAALKSYIAGNPHVPNDFCKIVDSKGAYTCCRVDRDPEVCRDCGYSITAELAQARRWNIGAIRMLASSA